MRKMRTTCGTFLALALPVAVCAATYKVDIDRCDGLYRCGETATFTVRVLSTNALAGAANRCARLDNFGSSVLTNMPFDVTTTGVAFTVSGTLSEPGFLRLSLPPTKSGRDDPYVFSVGFEPEKIRKGSPSPDDFDAFWAAARARLASEVPLDAQMTRVPERCTATFDFYRISFATFGRRVHGYMSVPTDKSKAPFPVDFGVNAAGFGDWTNDMQGERDSIRVQFSVYPFEPDWKWKESGLESKYKAMDAEVQAKYGAPRYCQAGITESREAYFFYPVILGIDRAVDWIAARPDVDKSLFRYQGTSQGGGFGFYLCGLNRAFTRAAFYVPAITDTMGYLAGRQSGWPQIVENNSSTLERCAAAEKWSPYFDGANFASRIKCPVRVAVGFSDTTCPPCAVYAAYNEIKVADKAIGNGIGMTHSCSGRFYDKFGKWVKDVACGDAIKSVTRNGHPHDPLFLRHGGIERSEGEIFTQASWIGVKGRFFHYNTRKEMRTAAVFAKDFTLEAKPEAAALKISVAGYWDIRVNGQEITEDILMPTPSNFDRRVYMKEYDIAPYLTAGVNRIEVTLGNSIYNCPTEGAWMQDTITWRDDPQLICEIVADGRIVAPSDATWRVHLDGPVRRNSIRCGETYDARKEILLPDGWEDAVKKHGPGGIIVSEPEKAAAKLDEIIRRQKGVMNCGMFGSKYIPRALAEYGYRDTAVLCFTQEAAPGWQWQKIEKGATTLWEYWNGNASRNHVIHGGDFPAWWAKYSKKAGK